MEQQVDAKELMTPESRRGAEPMVAGSSTEMVAAAGVRHSAAKLSQVQAATLASL